MRRWLVMQQGWWDAYRQGAERLLRGQPSELCWARARWQPRMQADRCAILMWQLAVPGSGRVSQEYQWAFLLLCPHTFPWPHLCPTAFSKGGTVSTFPLYRPFFMAQTVFAPLPLPLIFFNIPWRLSLLFPSSPGTRTTAVTPTELARRVRQRRERFGQFSFLRVISMAPFNVLTEAHPCFQSWPV